MKNIRDGKSTEEVKEFFDTTWNVYQKVLKYDYLYHSQMYQKLTQVITDKFKQTSFSILDLGCGDASYMAKELANFKVNSYTGIDVSKVALEIAQQNLKNVCSNLELIEKDFVAGMHDKIAQNEKFDVVFSSYALHHYPLAEKQQFLNHTQQLLNDNGVLIVIDIMLEEGQTLEHYHHVTMSEFYQTLDKLSPQELESAIGHISTSDVPETLRTYQNLATIALFNDCQLVYKQQFIGFFLYTR